MTAIRPRQSPEQQRREEARAHAEEARAHEKANRVLVSQPLFPLILAVLYLALLIVPWVLTCKIASQPSFIVDVYRSGRRYNVQHGWVIAINILNALATALSLPILSALLARAAVVFSQRRKPGQILSLRQLFALADRDWYNPLKALSPYASSTLLRFGFLVLLIAVTLPLVRSGLVGYDNVLVTSNLPTQYLRYDYKGVGDTPSPVIAKTAFSYDLEQVIGDTRKSLQATQGGIEPNLWPVCNDVRPESTCGFTYGPYDLAQSTLSNFFEDSYGYGYDYSYETNGSALMHASTLKAGSSVGSYYDNDYGAHTLGLKSGAKCEMSSLQELQEQCLGSIDTERFPIAARGWNTSLTIEGEVQLDICYPELETSPWETADASPWKPINFTEHLYISLRDEESAWDCGMFSDDCGSMGAADGLYIHCQADSMMSYFEIGSDRTKGAPTRFLDEMPKGFDVPRGYSATGYVDYSDDVRGPTDYTGPLKTATMAMFGNDSWLDTLKLAMADVEAANMTSAAALMMLCQMQPLGNIDSFGDTITCQEARYSSVYRRTSSELFSNLIREFFRSFRTRKLARATLNTATFYANNALLSLMKERSSYSTLDTKHSSEVSDQRMVVPVLPVAGIAVVSIFTALQVACIAILLVYIYSSGVWTLTLDALAMARVGAQLSALDVFLIPRETGTLGTARPSMWVSEHLDQIDGLVGSTAVVGRQHDIEMATMPPPYAPRGEEPSTREERRVSPPPTAAARDTAAHDQLVPSYSPPADGNTTRAPSGEAVSTGGNDEVTEMLISRAAPSESRGPALPGAISHEAVAVGGPGLITRRTWRMWRQADKPLPAPPAE